MSPQEDKVETEVTQTETQTETTPNHEDEVREKLKEATEKYLSEGLDDTSARLKAIEDALAENHALTMKFATSHNKVVTELNKFFTTGMGELYKSFRDCLVEDEDFISRFTEEADKFIGRVRAMDAEVKAYLSQLEEVDENDGGMYTVDPVYEDGENNTISDIRISVIEDGQERVLAEDDLAPALRIALRIAFQKAAHSTDESGRIVSVHHFALRSVSVEEEQEEAEEKEDQFADPT